MRCLLATGHSSLVDYLTQQIIEKKKLSQKVWLSFSIGMGIYVRNSAIFNALPLRPYVSGEFSVHFIKLSLPWGEGIGYLVDQ